MRREPKFKRLTPQRALTLLRDLDFCAGQRSGANAQSISALNDARDKLAEHVRAALVRSRVR